MRFDPTKDQAFSGSDQWLLEGAPRLFETGEGEAGNEIRSNSLSGLERNRLKLQRDGNFQDVSLVSGADFKEDGRGFVLFDHDQDGWLDIGLVSTHSPRFRILRNQMAELIPQNQRPQARVEVELVGGNTEPAPSSEWSSRDGYGARLEVVRGDETTAYNYACSEGLSVQNSRKLHIGMGANPKIDQLKVHWPSGRTTVLNDIPAGSSLVIQENESNPEEDQSADQ
ncbi:MAG: ASPIC/UnbV domain-containing protein [Mariniblastus sp.]|nr:ASPIC/UnbV domain-containing protein [Mariniblastus sp.]